MKGIKKHFEIVRVYGDGSCMYHAVGYGFSRMRYLFGKRGIRSSSHTGTGGETRKELAKYIEEESTPEERRQKNVGEFRGEYGKKNYFDGLKYNDFADDWEISNLAEMEDIHIKVFDEKELRKGDNNPVNIYDYNKNGKETVNILRTGDIHYDALVPIIHRHGSHVRTTDTTTRGYSRRWMERGEVWRERMMAAQSGSRHRDELTTHVGAETTNDCTIS